MNIPSSRTYAWWLALLRIFVGVFWFFHGLWKFTNPADFMPPNGSISAVVHRAALLPWPYHGFVVGVVQPHIELFAQLVRFGEVITGILLVLGLFTRLGGLLGVILGANYIIAASGSLGQTISSLGAAAVAVSAINLVLPTGRFLGLDALWKRNYYPRKDVTPPETSAVGNASVTKPEPVSRPNGADGGGAGVSP